MKKLFILSLLVLFSKMAFSDPCPTIQDIKCNSVVTFNSNGPGDPAYPNGMNGQGCSTGSTSQGGQEAIYQFIVPQNGTYQLNAVESNSNSVGYYYKRNKTSCNNTGWTCLN